jgi:hypothetical protein
MCGGPLLAVYSPTSGSQGSSPVHFGACASGKYPIIAMKVYSDGQVVDSVDASSIGAEVSIAVGNHWIVVQAWDNHGNVYKAPGFWIDVTSGGGGGGGPTYSMDPGIT